MEYIAARGYDVYLLDLRGYGRSTRPKEMAQKPDANPPIVRGDTAVKDIATVVDFILKRRSIPRLNLLGWSWGTTLMATYTTQNAAKVERLVLYAPAWIRQTAVAGAAGPGTARRLPHGGARPGARPLAHRRAGGQEGGAHSGRLVRAWADATWATDPEGAKTIRRCCARPTAWCRTASNSWRRQALLRSGQDHRADPAGASPNGTATRRPTWRRRCSRCSSTRPASATSCWPKAPTP